MNSLTLAIRIALLLFLVHVCLFSQLNGRENNLQKNKKKTKQHNCNNMRNMCNELGFSDSYIALVAIALRLPVGPMKC